MSRSLLLPIVVLAFAGSAAAQTLQPRQIAARARPAVVVIHALENGDTIGQGSGFIVRPDGTIVTNRHVIEGATRLAVTLADGERYERVFLVSEDSRRDLAVLRIPAASLPALPIGDDQHVEVGDPVYVMGNPMGLEGTFSNGLLSAKRTIDGVAMVQITAPISPGSSGGPVLNASGEVIGIATLMYDEGQNLNMAVPARHAAGLIALNETPVPFEQVASRLMPAESNAAEDDDDDLEPWIRALRDEVTDVTRIARDAGLRAAHEPAVDVIEADETVPVHFDFNPGDGEVLIIGVCDIDCTDLDLVLVDPIGRVIDRDDEPDDRPAILFQPIRTGTYTIRGTMAGCTTAACGYAILAFSDGR